MTEERENICMWQDRKHHLWFSFSSTRYYITNNRLMVKEGLLTTTINETLLCRIVDLGSRQTLAGKLFGIGDIIVKARVDATPEIILKNIKNPENVHNLISIAVEESCQHCNVVGKEFYGSDACGHMGLDGDGVCDFDGVEDNEQRLVSR